MKNLISILFAVTVFFTSCGNSQKQQVAITTVATPIVKKPELKEISPDQKAEWDAFAFTQGTAWQVRVAAQGNAWQARCAVRGNSWNEYLQERAQIVKDLEKVNPGRAQEWFEANASNNDKKREEIENLPVFGPWKIRLDAATEKYKQADLNAQREYERIDKEAQATFQAVNDSARKVYADRWEK